MPSPSVEEIEERVSRAESALLLAAGRIVELELECAWLSKMLGEVLTCLPTRWPGRATLGARIANGRPGRPS